MKQKHLTIKAAVIRLETIDINLMHREGNLWNKAPILSGEYDVVDVFEGNRKYTANIDILLSTISDLIIDGHPLKGTSSLMYVSVPKSRFTVTGTCQELRV